MTRIAIGTSMTMIVTAAITVVEARPTPAIPANRTGTPTMPPTLAPSAASETALP
jgi:hypothetical protein